MSVSAVVCEDCPMGRKEDQKSSTSCDACGQGHYQNQTGQTSCERCTQGSYTTISSDSNADAVTEGAIYCLPCRPGRYSGEHDINYAYANCTLCAKGHAQPERGADYCEECGSGTT